MKNREPLGACSPHAYTAVKEPMVNVGYKYDTFKQKGYITIFR